MSLNKVMLIGNVGRDPEVRYLEQNQQNQQGQQAPAKVASFTLATTERFRDRSGNIRENTEWHNIVAWRNSADIAEKYIRKGTQIYVEGRLRSRSWDGQDGQKHYTTEVVVDNLQLLGKRPDGQDAVPQGAAPLAQGYAPTAPAQVAAPQGYAPAAPVQPVAPAYQQPQYQAMAQAPQPVAPATPAADGPEDDLPF